MPALYYILWFSWLIGYLLDWNSHCWFLPLTYFIILPINYQFHLSGYLNHPRYLKLQFFLRWVISIGLWRFFILQNLFLDKLLLISSRYLSSIRCNYHTHSGSKNSPKDNILIHKHICHSHTIHFLSKKLNILHHQSSITQKKGLSRMKLSLKSLFSDTRYSKVLEYFGFSGNLCYY